MMFTGLRITARAALAGISPIALAAGVGVPAAAHAQNTASFDIPAQPLSSAVLEYSRQSKILVVVDPTLVTGKQSAALRGSFAPEEALRRMLAGTTLRAQRSADGGLVLKEAPGESAGDSIAASTEDAVSMGDIIVTAQKRDERLLDVPSSIAVLTGDQLDKKGMIKMDDYLRVMPGVNSLDLGNSLKRIVFRGIGTDPEIERMTSSVYFGEIPVSASAGSGGSTSSDLRMVDIERVEVLRGPQGTLYGASSLGGLLRQIPVKPKLDAVEGEIAGGYSSTQRLGGENTTLRGMLNVPLIEDKLAVRLVGYRYFDSGFYENVAASDPTYADIAATYGGIARDERRVGDAKTFGGRISLLFRPTEAFNAELTYIKQRDEGGRTEAMTGLDDYQQTRLQTVIDGVVASPNRKADLDIGSLVLGYDFGPLSLSSSSSHIRKKQASNYDVTVFLGQPVSTTEPERSKILTQELRLASQFQGPFQFLLGTYYEDITERTYQDILWAGDPALNTTYGQAGDILIYNSIGKTDRKQLAFFGELSFDITQNLTAKAGGRYFKYKTSVFNATEGLFGTGTGQFKSKENGTNFSASLDYKIDRNAMLYARWAQGFRPGIAVDDTIARSSVCDANGDGIVDGLGIAAPTQIKADTVDNYEVGMKGALGGITFSAAAYRIDWEGIPLSVRSPSPCFGIFTINAGKARSQGLEFEGLTRLSDNLKLDFSASYTDAKLLSDVPDIGGSKGDRLPATPKYKFNMGFQYDQRFDPYDFFARADYSYISGFSNNVTGDVDASGLQAGKYHQINLRTGAAMNRISVELFVNNLLNEVAYTWVGLRFAGTAYYLRPRTAGVELKYKF